MKWFQMALMFAPMLGLVIPGAGPVVAALLPLIAQAQQLHGDTDNAAKKAMVYTGVAAAVTTGKIKLPMPAVVAITDAVFKGIDDVHVIVQANQTIPGVTVPPPVLPAA